MVGASQPRTHLRLRGCCRRSDHVRGYQQARRSSCWRGKRASAAVADAAFDPRASRLPDSAADCTHMHCGRVFFTQSSRGELRFECGASWEVDLRSDADCASSSLGRCHPRYTLGSAAREVSLFRGERQLPHRAEYAHAFCDAWGSGRIENVHLAPSQRDEAQQRSAAHHAACLLLTRHALHRCARALCASARRSSRRRRRRLHRRRGRMSATAGVAPTMPAPSPRRALVASASSGRLIGRISTAGRIYLPTTAATPTPTPRLGATPLIRRCATRSVAAR